MIRVLHKNIARRFLTSSTIAAMIISMALTDVGAESVSEATPAISAQGEKTLGRLDAQPVATQSAAGQQLCNSVVFSQIPKFGDYFLGRVLNTEDDGVTCVSPQESWSLALFKMNWRRNILTMVRYVLPLNQTNNHTVASNPFHITTAYDPSVAYYNGEYWIAFECGSHPYGSKPWQYGTSTCIAPLDVSSGVESAHVDAERMSVAVYSGPLQELHPLYRYSASVPKLFTYNNRLYVYWSSLKIQILNAGGKWIQSTTRGVELQQEQFGLRRIWAVGSNEQPFSSIDPRTREVLGTEPGDPTSDSLATIFGVFTEGRYIYATAGIGGSGCTRPRYPSYGCFRLAIFRAETPLDEHGFNGNAADRDAIPFNPQVYSRFFKDPDGNNFIMGRYYSLPKDVAKKIRDNILPEGEWRYYIDPYSLHFSTNHIPQ